jgi:hypothetical protein
MATIENVNAKKHRSTPLSLYESALETRQSRDCLGRLRVSYWGLALRRRKTKCEK